MILIPKDVYAKYLNCLKRNKVAEDHYQEYIKWLRYFLDFCEKHVIAHEKTERVRLFQEKLREKRQSEEQCQRAAHAVSLYLEMQTHASQLNETAPEANTQSAAARESVRAPIPGKYLLPSQYNEAGYREKSDSPEWDEVISKLADEIKVRHYSRKTLRTYAHWSRQFQKFLKNKPPQELITDDVKEYLTWLAVKCHVAASTQNQAFNSLLFLFRHALKRDFGELRDVPRAKKSLYSGRVIGRRL